MANCKNCGHSHENKICDSRLISDNDIHDFDDFKYICRCEKFEP